MRSLLQVDTLIDLIYAELISYSDSVALVYAAHDTGSLGVHRWTWDPADFKHVYGV